MTEKWLSEDEYIILEGKAWASFKTPLGPGSSRSKVYLTNKRLYGKDSVMRTKMFDIQLSDNTNIEKKKSYLRIETQVKGKKKWVEMRLKDLDDSWEWMINERIKVLKR
jgi:hypothetical protein